jgi:hypothetical protein
MDVRSLGIPVVTFITQPFRALAAAVARATLGTADAPIVTLPPVFETVAPDIGRRLAEECWDDIAAALLAPASRGGVPPNPAEARRSPHLPEAAPDEG